MQKRSSSRPPTCDAHPARRVPIAMSVALEVVAELRAREQQNAAAIMNELFAAPRPAPRR